MNNDTGDRDGDSEERKRAFREHVERLHKEQEKAQFLWKAREQRARDNLDARTVQSLRQLGVDLGREAEYEKKAQEFLKRNGYRDGLDPPERRKRGRGDQGRDQDRGRER